MLFALFLAVVIALFLVAMERLEDRVLGSHAPGMFRSRVAAPTPAAGSVGSSGAHGARHNRNEADIDRQGSGRPSEGDGPWTHR
jgi:hypothetical protein